MQADPKPARRALRVYVSGPYSSSGTIEDNVANVRAATADLLLEGLEPFAPHLICHEMDTAGHRFDWDRWMQWCLSWLPVCDAMYRLPGVSRGADIEEQEALHLGLPVCRTLAEVRILTRITEW